jgi:hypothetical protein
VLLILPVRPPENCTGACGDVGLAEDQGEINIVVTPVMGNATQDAQDDVSLVS